ncbi:hypothetical protein PENSPDRAFT_672523 [Peniophora sp. CONT]|nr:hypothetical protein PENSPDRAFT_672523 [Peniophora sp. CONT]
MFFSSSDIAPCSAGTLSKLCSSKIRFAQDRVTVASCEALFAMSSMTGTSSQLDTMWVNCDRLSVRTVEDIATVALQPASKKPRRPAASSQPPQTPSSDTPPSTDADAQASMTGTSDKGGEPIVNTETATDGHAEDANAHGQTSGDAGLAINSPSAVSGSHEIEETSPTQVAPATKTSATPAVASAPDASTPSTVPVSESSLGHQAVNNGAQASTATNGKAKQATPVPRAPAPLKSSLAITLRGGGVPGIIEAASLSEAFVSREEGGERIWKMLRLPGCYPNAVNLANADPTLFNGSTRYVTTYDRPPETAVFYLHGIVTHNGLDDDNPTRGRQICMAPFDLGLSRALAILRRFCGDGYFFMNSFKKGLSFSTGNFNSRVGDDLNAFRPVLTRDTPVPVYDGRERFLWSKYDELPRLSVYEVDKGMVCAVLFTIGFYRTTAKNSIVRSVVRKTASLNLQAVVILDNPNPYNTAEGIAELDGPLDEGVQLDPSLLLASAINPGAVAQAPSRSYDAHEEMA